MAAAQRDGSILRSTSMDRVTSYGSFGGHSLDRTTSFDSGDNSGSPRSASSFEVCFLSMTLHRMQHHVGGQAHCRCMYVACSSQCRANAAAHTGWWNTHGACAVEYLAISDMQRLTSCCVCSQQKLPAIAPLPPAVTRSKESSASGSSGASAGSKGSPKPPMRGVIPVHSDARVPHSPADSVSEITAGREVDPMKLAAAAHIRADGARSSGSAGSEIQPVA